MEHVHMQKTEHRMRAPPTLPPMMPSMSVEVGSIDPETFGEGMVPLDPDVAGVVVEGNILKVELEISWHTTPASSL